MNQFLYCIYLTMFFCSLQILALLVEGRRGSQSSRRRPNSSNYRKLDTNLEEAITSPAPRSTNSHVIYWLKTACFDAIRFFI